MLDLITPETVHPQMQALQFWIKLSNPDLTEEQISQFLRRIDTCVRVYPEYTFYKCVEFAVMRYPEFGFLLDDDHRTYTQLYCITRSERHLYWAGLINDHFGRELPGLDAWFLGYVAICLWIKNIYLIEEILFQIQCIYIDVDRNGKTFTEALYDNTGSAVDAFSALWLLAVVVDVDRCTLTNLSAAAMD
jgi:hypothetical protein